MASVSVGNFGDFGSWRECIAFAPFRLVRVPCCLAPGILDCGLTGFDAGCFQVRYGSSCCFVGVDACTVTGGISS